MSETWRGPSRTPQSGDRDNYHRGGQVLLQWRARGHLRQYYPECAQSHLIREAKAGSGLVSTWIGEHSGLRKQRRDRKRSEGGAVREGFPREHRKGQQDSAQVNKKGKAKGDRCGSDTQPHRGVQIRTVRRHCTSIRW